jgi:hypothetical protein
VAKTRSAVKSFSEIDTHSLDHPLEKRKQFFSGEIHVDITISINSAVNKFGSTVPSVQDEHHTVHSSGYNEVSYVMEILPGPHKHILLFCVAMQMKMSHITKAAGSFSSNNFRSQWKSTVSASRGGTRCMLMVLPSEVSEKEVSQISRDSASKPDQH